MEVSSSTSPILFLDCVNYSHRDPDRHDTTYPYKHSVWAALKSDRGRLPDKDVQILLDNLRDAIKFCNDVSTSADNIDEMLQNQHFSMVVLMKRFHSQQFPISKKYWRFVSCWNTSWQRSAALKYMTIMLSLHTSPVPLYHYLYTSMTCVLDASSVW